MILLVKTFKIMINYLQTCKNKYYVQKIKNVKLVVTIK